MDRKYYSIRTKKRSDIYNISILKRLFVNFYLDLESKGYFDENFGYDCVDNGYIVGKLGPKIESVLFQALLVENLWPIKENIVFYDEDKLFDVIEFLYDYVSEPLEEDGYYHNWNNCGWHYKKFNKENGRKFFREKINEIISNYKDGFQLSSNGQIFVLGEKDLETILDAEISSNDKDLNKKISNAVSRYRASRSILDERRIAIRELADVLEALKPEAEKLLENKDETALFNLANNFAIRHHNEKQKTKYDKSIWYSWMFYYYLSTIHALLRMKEKSK